MQINRLDDKIITTSIRASDIYYQPIYDANYVSTGNRVVDMTNVSPNYITSN